jgi:hypothetical protein
MKAGDEHVVPLSDDALKVLERRRSIAAPPTSWSSPARAGIRN